MRDRDNNALQASALESVIQSAAMRWNRLLAYARLTTIVALLLFPFLFSMVANVTMQHTLSRASSIVNKIDAVFTDLRQYSDRLAVSESLVSLADIADVLELQRRLEATPLPVSNVTEYFLAVDRYLIGMGYSFVRPELFYRGRVVPVNTSGTELRRSIEESDFAMTLVRSEPQELVPSTLLVAYNVPLVGTGMNAKNLALIDISDYLEEAAAAGFHVSIAEDRFVFARNPSEESHRTLIQSNALPLSYVIAHSEGLLTTPIYLLLIISFGIALIVIVGDVALFAGRLRKVEPRALLFYRQRLASGRPFGALLSEYFHHTSFTLRTSQSRFQELVHRWMQHGEISNRELDMILLTLRLPTRARYCVAYFDQGAMLRRTSGDVTVRPFVHLGRQSYAIVSTTSSTDSAFRTALLNCFDGGLGVGNLCSEAAQLPTSFLEAKEAYNRRSDEAHSITVAFFTDLPAIQWESFHFPINVEANLLNAIRVGNTERFTTIVRELYEQNGRAYSSSERMWNAFVHNMQCSLLKLLPEIKYRDNRDGLLIKEQILDITDSPRSSETVVATCRRMAHLFMGSRQNEQNELFRSIRRYIDESFRDQSLSLKMLAAEFDLSESHISRNVKDQLGLPYHQYVEQLRLDFAVRQIIETHHTLSDIALKSGYANLNTFRKAFVRRFALSPQAYRRRYRSNGTETGVNTEKIGSSG